MQKTEFFEIMFERSGFGETGETYWVDLDHVLITPSRFAQYRQGEVHVYTQVAKTVLEKKIHVVLKNPYQNDLLAQSLCWRRGSSPRNTIVCLRLEPRLRLDLEPKSSF